MPPSNTSVRIVGETFGQFTGDTVYIDENGQRWRKVHKPGSVPTGTTLGVVDELARVIRPVPTK